MKKKYIAPEMLSLGCETVLPIAASLIENGNQATVIPDENDTYDGNDWGSRSNVWSDDGYGSTDW